MGKNTMHWVLLLMLLLVGSPLSAQKVWQKMSVDQQYYDWYVLETALKESHAGLYHYRDSMAWEQRFEEARKFLSKERSRWELFRFYHLLIAEIRCGHTSVMDKHFFGKDSRQVKAYLPLDLYPVNGKVLARNDYCQQGNCIRKYDEILALDQHPMEEILKELLLFLPSDGYNTTFPLEILKREFNRYLFLAYGAKESYQLLYKNAQGDTLSLQIPTVDNSLVRVNDPRQFDFDRPSLARIFFQQNLALLQPPVPLSRDAEYLRKVDVFFEKIHQLNIEHLIIDLRDNPGGLSQEWVAAYLTDSSYQYVRNRFQGSPHPSFSEYIKGKFNRNYLTVKLFGIFNRGVDQEAYLSVVPREPRFGGHLYVLVNGMTFSAASNLASNLKEKSGALVVGTESGGGYRYCNSGNLLLELPYSKFRITINPIGFDNLPLKTYPADGVLPDIPLPEDERWDRPVDLQLIYLIKMIENLPKSEKKPY
jgi:hypothetical protein